MRIQIFQHIPFEGPGTITTWMNDRGHTYRTTHFWNGDRTPSPDDFDALIVLGGEMGVHDDAAYPWLSDEKAFLKEVVPTGKKILGICLGAQLMAHTLGATIQKNPYREVGWFPVERVESSEPMLEDFPHRITVFHWHGDTFAIPQDARHILRSEACETQGYIWNDQVLGLQFHMEAEAHEISEYVGHWTKEFENRGKFVQPPSIILSHLHLVPQVTPVLFGLLDRFFATSS